MGTDPDRPGFWDSAFITLALLAVLGVFASVFGLIFRMLREWNYVLRGLFFVAINFCVFWVFPPLGWVLVAVFTYNEFFYPFNLPERDSRYGFEIL
ncbi:Uu.00g083400.m01.CDS01 [Anthostomella pinea]|uniref:Uu.00g083400.m01.CDS01 n=1 Tax=Anthostomella pinea TaxID=933095 RepID=A0AAI8YH73_9PEZI|nr:Uu.00g083400.m01.CDS01 [Anthostomella pinea]